MITNSRTTTMRSCASHVRGDGTTKRLTTIAAATGVGIGAIGSPVAADRPAEFETSLVFAGVNPCTGTPMEVTVDAVVRLHEHGDPLVAHISRTGSTDDGYVTDHGVETALSNGNLFHQGFTDTFRNEEGSKFQARGVLVEREDGVRVDRLTLRCLGR